MALSSDSLADMMRSWKELIDRTLDEYLGDALDCPSRLKEAMRYSVFAGGKRLRPILTLMANEACMGAIDVALPAACAVEMVHTYSLIHDDLPAMDDDALRRGQPTCHCKFDEATAILAGDGLLTLAFETLARISPTPIGLQCVKELARAAGAAGMVGGQMDDLRRPDDIASLDWLESLHRRKTGALLVCSLRMGALIAGASREQLEALTAYGQNIGLAFQIADDLLDEQGDQEKMGKQVRKDVAAGKLTYPGLLGISASRDKARELIASAREQLKAFGPAGGRLAVLADYIVEREC